MSEAIARRDVALSRVNAARVALARARSVDEVKKVHDQAEAIRLYAKTQKMGLGMQNDAAEISIRAAVRGGELLEEMNKTGKRRKSGHRGKKKGERAVPPFLTKPTLTDVGLNKRTATEWRLLAPEPEKVEAYIEKTRAAGGEITTAGALRTVKEAERETKREENRERVKSAAPLPDEEFKTVVLDPPWDWGDEGDKDQFGRATPTYGTLSYEELLKLDVGGLVGKNAHIYLWITNRSLPKGFPLLEAWGFRYVTCLTWVKPSFGMGNYFRGSTEQVLFGVRGSLPLLRSDVGTHFAAKRPGRHSAKPPEFFTLVESCSPGPWLEMFSRSQRPGWTVWGAEVSE